MKDRNNILVNGISSALRDGADGRVRFKISPEDARKVLSTRGGVDQALRQSVRRGGVDPALIQKPMQTVAEGASSALGSAAAERVTSSSLGNAAAAGAVAGVAGAGALAAGALAPSGEKTDRVLEKAEDVLNKAGMAAFVVPMGGNLLGGAMSKVGKWTGTGFLQRGGEKTKNIVQAVETATFGDVSKKVGAGGFFTKITQPVADVVAVVGDKLTKWTGIQSWRSNANTGKAAVAHGKALDVATAMEKNMAHAPADIRPHLDTMIKAAKGHHTQIDAAALETAGKAIGEFEAKNLSNQAKSLMGEAGKLGGHLGDAAHYAGKAKGWKDVKGAVKAMPKGVSNTAVMHGVFNGTFIASSGISMVMDTRNLSRNIDSLKQMYKDLTGENDVSSLKLFLGSVPKPIADVRGKLIANYGLKQVLDTVNIGIQFSRVGPMKAMASMMGVMALSGVANSMLSTDVIPAYKTFSDMHKSGKPISAEDYAAFVALASKDVQSRDPAFAQALGEQYAAEKASPAQILKEIDSLKLAERIRGVMAANETKAKAPTYVEKLNGAAAAERPVVGAHTASENARAATRNEVTQRV